MGPRMAEYYTFFYLLFISQIRCNIVIELTINYCSSEIFYA